MQPLREEDRAYYLFILSVLKVMSDETHKKGRVRQLCHNRRRQHMAMVLEQDEVIDNSNRPEGKYFFLISDIQC